MEMELIEMAIDRIKPDNTQPRKTLIDISELAEDIKQHGLLHNIAVDDKGVIIYGERRWRAYQTLKKETGDKRWDKIPVKQYKDITPLERLQLQLSENSQRKDIAPLEKAMAWKRFLEMYQQDKIEKLKTIVKMYKEGVKQRDIAKQVKMQETHLSTLLKKLTETGGTLDYVSFSQEFHHQGYSALAQIENKSRETIRDTIKLLDIPAMVQKAIEKELIKPAYIIECYKIEDKQERDSFMKELVKDFLDINEQHEAKIRIVTQKLEEQRKKAEEQEKKRKAQLEFLEKQKQKAKDLKDLKELEQLAKQAEKVKQESKKELDMLKELEKEKKEEESKLKDEIKQKTEEKEILSTSKKTREVVQELNKKELIFAVKESLKKGEVSKKDIEGFDKLSPEEQLETLQEVLEQKKKTEKLGKDKLKFKEYLEKNNIQDIRKKANTESLLRKLINDFYNAKTGIERVRYKIEVLKNFKLPQGLEVDVFSIFSQKEKLELLKHLRGLRENANDYLEDLIVLIKEIEVIVENIKSEDELYLRAIELNAAHGLQLSYKDKQSIAVKLYDGKNSDRLIKALSISQQCFSVWTKNKRQSLEDERNQMILDLYLKCWTMEEIGSEVDLTRQAISDIISKLSNNTKYSKILQMTDFSPFLYNIWNSKEGNNDTKHFGQFPPIFMENLLYYYTEPFDVVYDPFAGGGTTIDVCKKWFRRYFVSDLNPTPAREEDIKKWDITSGLPDKLPTPDFIFLDPPYWKQAEGKYSKDKNDLGNMDLEEFYKTLQTMLSSLKKKLKDDGYITLVIQPTQWKNNKQFEDHIMKIYGLFEKLGFEEEMRYCLPYLTEQYNPQMVEVAKKEKLCLNLIRDLVVFKKSKKGK